MGRRSSRGTSSSQTLHKLFTNWSQKIFTKISFELEGRKKKEHAVYLREKRRKKEKKGKKGRKKRKKEEKRKKEGKNEGKRRKTKEKGRTKEERARHATWH